MGSWHVALPKLQKLSNDESTDRYPNRNLAELEHHVEEVCRGRQEKRERRKRRFAVKHGKREPTWHRGRRRDQGKRPERERRSEQLEERRHVWWQPSYLNSPPPASSSTSQLPAQKIKPEPFADAASDDADGDDSYASEIRILDSDGSGTSIFGLRSALREVEECYEPSEPAPQDDNEKAVAERDRGNNGMIKSILQSRLELCDVLGT